MEGGVARWYARIRRSGGQFETYRKHAVQLTEGVPDGAAVLEVAPGPGYLAVEIARLGRYRMTGLDISHTFVQIASDYARQAGVTVDFRQGDVAALPFAAESFDLIVCQAAFKNFTAPVRALDEMYRVLRPGGWATIQDMNHDATNADIDREVAQMRLSRWNAMMTRSTLRMLRRRAYSTDRFARLAADSLFRACDVHAAGIELEVRLTKP
jgi:ubiquinone/menaquinone biosynthesis C-methylase UbiE